MIVRDTVGVAGLALLVVTITLSAVSGAQAQIGARGTPMNPNLAGADELRQLPLLTESIVDGLMERRPFLSMVDLHAYLSAVLSADQRSELYPRLFVPINLNTATREEFLLVPGVGDRMAHEFEEYRPYRAVAQFRREIGKYVDDDEVGRFERYVFVPVDLNTASDDEIRSIPGVGDRLAREFKEYRPYRGIEQFRREIGKYVDDDEVARLKRYVVVE